MLWVGCKRGWVVFLLLLIKKGELRVFGFLVDVYLYVLLGFGDYKLKKVFFMYSV